METLREENKRLDGASSSKIALLEDEYKRKANADEEKYARLMEGKDEECLKKISQMEEDCSKRIASMEEEHSKQILSMEEVSESMEAEVKLRTSLEEQLTQLKAEKEGLVSKNEEVNA